MWEGSYGKEPFDLRLTVLRLIRQLHIITAVTLLGTLVFGGGYCIEHLLGAEKLYCAVSTYHVEYAVEEEKDVGTVYINETSWNTYLTSGEFLDAVQERTETGMTNQELAETLHAVLASDLRVPSTEVTTKDPDTSVKIAQAVEAVMTEIFPAKTKEVLSIRVIDSAVEAPLAEEDVRPGRAFALSAVLSCFFAVVVLLLKELWEDAVWLPATVRRRYGQKAVGTPESAALKENMRYFFGAKQRVAVCAVQEEAEPARLIEVLRQRCPETVGEEGWYAVPSPALCPESCRALREADGILLAVAAGRHAGKQLEYTMEYLEQQDCSITAVILCGADEWLIRNYYRFQKEKRTERDCVPERTGT